MLRAMHEVLEKPAASAPRTFPAGRFVQAMVGDIGQCRSCATLPKEPLHQGSAFVQQNPGGHGHAVVVGGAGQPLRPANDGAGTRSGAPKTKRSMRAWTKAPTHIMQGSTVTYSVAPGSR